MCLAIPAKVIKVDGGVATVNLGGVEKEASLLLLDDVSVGDYVIIHAGFAINKLDKVAAEESLRILRELASLAP